MSITYDSERWSSAAKAREIEQAQARPRSPRIVAIGDLPYFKARTDIQGDALFRQFTGENESTARVIRKLDKGEACSDD